jgi:hypothetical protein
VNGRGLYPLDFFYLHILFFIKASFMNFQMFLSRDPEDMKIVKDEFEKLATRFEKLLPELDKQKEELLKVQERLVAESAPGYFFTTDWEIDLGVFFDTGKTPAHFDELEFYGLLIFYFNTLQTLINQQLLRVEERLVAAADAQFFHLKDLAEQGNAEAKKAYEELKKLRPGGDKP